MRAIALTVLVAAAVAACAAKDSSTRPVDDPLPARSTDSDGWVPVFSDDFDGEALDPSRWLAWEGDRHHKGTINTSSKAMATVAGGALLVGAVPDPTNAAFPYTAGYINTDGLFAQTYGKIEFRARARYAPGVWYAVWGRPWTHAVPEIDVELLGENPSQVWLVNHWDLPPVRADDRRRFVTVDGTDFTDFHTYTITWTTELLEWAIDGQAYMRVTDRGVPHEPVFWTINVWVGGWAGNPGPGTVFPAHIEVDWFRVYRPATWATAPAVRVGNLRERYSVGDEVHVELADFDAGARVDVFDGDRPFVALERPPFRFKPRGLPKGPCALRIVATDGVRTATTSLEATIY